MPEKLLSGFCKALQWLKNCRGRMTAFYTALISAVLYYCLEVGNRNFLFNGFFYTFVNIISVFFIIGAVYLIVQRWWLASSVVAPPLVLLSVANSYTIQFRNLPISTQDIHNMGTTMSVIGSYKFTLTVYVVVILILAVLCFFLIKKLYRTEKGKKRNWKREIVKNGCLIVCGFLFLHGIYFAENSIKPKNTFVWSWEETYYKYGFVASSVEIFQKSVNVVSKPENYDVKNISHIVGKKAEYSDYKTPDIILILNETFYDLRDVLDLTTDTEIMPFIDGLENVIKGRTVVAGTGGGTNRCEYELLTSNSLQLMPGITPFNYLDFSNADSIVSHLENLGYTTWGAHCAPGLNYSRSNVYPKLGFDTVKFQPDFRNTEFYGDRYYATDAACYREMLEDYEKMGENPRFMYMLTIQNHGGWELNGEEMDTVHTNEDFGDYTDDINEFLTCIRQSDEAFREITEYFSNSQRPVIVCMLGDHAPSFAQEINTSRDEETVFRLRSTPYVIWANFDIENPRTETISVPMVVPRLFEAARVPLSPYYSYMLELKQSVPVVTANNMFMDKDGKSYYYTDANAPYREELDTYFDLLYNNVGPKDERIDELFKPVK